METATDFTGAGVFTSGLGDQQNGFFSDYYHMTDGINEKPLDLGLDASWDIPGGVDPKLKYAIIQQRTFLRFSPS